MIGIIGIPRGLNGGVPRRRFCHSSKLSPEPATSLAATRTSTDANRLHTAPQGTRFTRTVTTEYNDFKRHLKIRFVSPQHSNQVLATFSNTIESFAQTSNESSGGCGPSQ